MKSMTFIGEKLERVVADLESIVLHSVSGRFLRLPLPSYRVQLGPLKGLTGRQAAGFIRERSDPISHVEAVDKGGAFYADRGLVIYTLHFTHSAPIQIFGEYDPDDRSFDFGNDFV